jgi:CheY-like chemotaxis protein
MAMVKFGHQNKEPHESASEPWVILIADDEKSVHVVTEMVLQGVTFEGRPLQFLSAYSALETIELLGREPNIAVVLLDVVMENWNAGLDAVPVIREHLGLHDVRIVIRTGQSGKSTVSEVIREYDINDFRDKVKLDQGSLTDLIILMLRSYRDIRKAREDKA